MVLLAGDEIAGSFPSALFDPDNTNSQGWHRLNPQTIAGSGRVLAF